MEEINAGLPVPLGMGWYSNSKLNQTGQYIRDSLVRIGDVNKAVLEAGEDIASVSKNIGDVQISIKETSDLAQQVYHKPLQSINFARTAQNDFTSVDFALFKAFQKGTLKSQSADIQESYELFEENFAIAEERSISEDSKEYIAEIKDLSGKWKKQADSLIAGRATYEAIEPISEKMQEALANLVEFEASAGYDFVLESEKTTERANQVSGSMKQSAEKVISSAKSIQDSAANAESTVKQAIADTYKIQNTSKFLTAITFVASVIVVAALAYDIITQINAAQKIANQIAGGQFSDQISSRRRDEFGKLINAMGMMQTDLLKNKELEKKTMDSALQGAQESKNRQKSLSRLSDRLTTEISSIMNVTRKALEDLQKIADSLAVTAQKSKNNSESVIGDINEMSGAVTTIASAVEELSASVDGISERTAQSSQTAKNAVVQASDAKAAVESLSNMSSRVGEIISMINDIAEQTNLLALNATIEAARAGDAGKGFAVVATEVKSLASETAKATEQISTQITEIQSISEKCVRAIQAIIETIDQMKGASASIDHGMNDQKNATSEISQQTYKTSSRMSQAAVNMNDMAKDIDVVYKSSEDVLESIQSINQEMKRMDNSIKTITDEIRKAS